MAHIVWNIWEYGDCWYLYAQQVGWNSEIACNVNPWDFYYNIADSLQKMHINNTCHTISPIMSLLDDILMFSVFYQSSLVLSMGQNI